jgi:AcrR family transcriptional regulator
MAKATLTPEDWIEAGIAQLSAQGPSALRAESLARFLKTTKGSFYWHFKDVPTYQAQVLDHWKTTALNATDALKGAEGSAAERMIAFGQTVQSDTAESALRAWARTDTRVADTLADVDGVREAHLAALMKEMGNDNADFAKAAYGSLLGLQLLQIEKGDALIAFAALADLVLSAN